jgi:hypothetical protein
MQRAIGRHYVLWRLANHLIELKLPYPPEPMQASFLSRQNNAKSAWKVGRSEPFTQDSGHYAVRPVASGYSGTEFIYIDFTMSRFSTSFEPSGSEMVKFAVAALSVLMGISGIIFDQPVLGILGIVLLVVTLAVSLRGVRTD